MSNQEPIDEGQTVGTFDEALRRSEAIWKDLPQHPEKYRVLTGDRPTGSLHLGHYFGSLMGRVNLQNLGVETYIVIADYQVLTDRDSVSAIGENVRELVLDYLAAGLDPFGKNTHIFPHSHVPALNQMLLPFLTLVGMGELDRNPTVKEEIQAANLKTINASMYTYPVHQAADILFCKGNVVPVGRDQLPHLELTRKIARRFNHRFCPESAPLLPEPDALLSEAPKILGLDGAQKMSKSRGNAIFLKDSPDDTAKKFKSAKTDSERVLSFDPVERPEVSNLLLLMSLISGKSPQEHAEEINQNPKGGSGLLKSSLTELLNDFLAPLRQKRNELAEDSQVVDKVLRQGIEKANQTANTTLREMREVMNMGYGL